MIRPLFIVDLGIEYFMWFEKYFTMSVGQLVDHLRLELLSFGIAGLVVCFSLAKIWPKYWLGCAIISSLSYTFMMTFGAAIQIDIPVNLLVSTKYYDFLPRFVTPILMIVGSYTGANIYNKNMNQNRHKNASLDM